jgi:hypothetical protein
MAVGPGAIVLDLESGPRENSPGSCNFAHLIWVRKLSISATGVYVKIKGQKYNDNDKETTF